MSGPSPPPTRRAGVLCRINALPVLVKILGVGLLVGLLFGGIVLIHTRQVTEPALYSALEAQTLSRASLLASNLEKPMATGSHYAVQEGIRRAAAVLPDVRYAFVQDPEGQVVAHTFVHGVPPDLLVVDPGLVSDVGQVEVLDSSEGLIFDAAVPLLRGRGGLLRLGVSSRSATSELRSLTHSLLWALALCFSVGSGLALLLAYTLTRPLRLLRDATQKVYQGDFQVRAEVFCDDEIGRVAEAFNRMTEGLQRYRQEVEEKERSRLALLERTVHVQEEERRRISRELHDHLGQSLLASLLTVQSECRYSGLESSNCHSVASGIRQSIDEIRQLAWGMRPAILDDCGLDSALRRYIQEVSKKSGIAMDYEYTVPPGLGRLPNRIEVALYRIAQEGVTNIVRHAQATRASVVVLHRGDDVTLVIEDSGRGCDLDSPGATARRGVGLAAMTERASLCGGSFTIESAQGSGTTVRVTLPSGGDRECLSAS